MDPIVDDILMHYGVKRRSGRYPWGSGENPYQHGGDFLTRVEELEALGKSQKEIAEELKMSTTDLRMQVRVAKHERRALQAERAKSLREEGKTLDEIAKIMGYNNDSSVRALLNENILRAYGEKSPDGKRFIKSQELRDAFAQTEAYSDLFMELATDADAAARFINGIIPQGKKSQIPSSSPAPQN